MHQRDFKWPGGFKVEAFVNGDFKMLDTVMGNQPSANHPRLKNSVYVSHLKRHDGIPYFPGNCK